MPVFFPKDTRIFREGDLGDGCYLIEHGSVRLELQNSETETDYVLGFLEPGMFLGEFSLLDNKPRSASAFAHTDVKAQWLSIAHFNEILQSNADLASILLLSLGQDLTAKMRGLVSKFTMNLFSDSMFTDRVDADTNETVARAVAAQKAFNDWTEARVDALLYDISTAIAEHAHELAEKTVLETDMGNVKDKTFKNRYASLDIYNQLAGRPAGGILESNPQTKVTEIGSPLGVVLALIPVTSPIAVLIFKVLVGLKGRNALILSCHHAALGVGLQSCKIIQRILLKHGASKDLVQTIQKKNSRQKAMTFMHHAGVSFIWATGSASMVKAAYSSGKPAIGVGDGNAPALICADCNLSKAAKAIIDSKSFDNGLMCASENNLVVVSAVFDEFVKHLQIHGAAVLSSDEKERFTASVFDLELLAVKKSLVGKSTKILATIAGFDIDPKTRLLVVPAENHELQGVYGREKLAPIISLFRARDETEGFQLCKQLLANQGNGHTAAIHTASQERIKQFGCEMPAGRIIANAPASQGCIGINTGLVPSFSMGCGSFAGNSTTENVSYKNLINIKRLAQGLD